MFLLRPSRIMAVKPRLGTVRTTSARPSFSQIQRSIPTAKQNTMSTAITTSRLNSLLLKTSCSVSKSTKASVKYQCPKCDFQAEDKNDMKNHVVVIHKSKPFVCFHCEETFSNFKVMQSHVKALHPEVGVIKEPYTLVSGMDNTKLKGSKKTTLSTKGTSPAPSDQGSLPQEINAVHSSSSLVKSAGKTSNAANNMVDENKAKPKVKKSRKNSKEDHVLKKSEEGIQAVEWQAKNQTQKNLQLEMEVDANNKNVSKSAKNSVMYQCPKCDFQAEDKNDMKNHIVVIHKSKPFVCFHCEETFSNFKVMQSHIKALHPEVDVVKEPYALVSEMENIKLKGSSKTATLSTKGTNPAPSDQSSLTQEIKSAVQSCNKARDTILDQSELKPKGKKMKKTKNEIGITDIEIEAMLKILEEGQKSDSTKSKDNKLNIAEHLNVKAIKDKNLKDEAYLLTKSQEKVLPIKQTLKEKRKKIGKRNLEPVTDESSVLQSKTGPILTQQKIFEVPHFEQKVKSIEDKEILLSTSTVTKKEKREQGELETSLKEEPIYKLEIKYVQQETENVELTSRPEHSQKEEQPQYVLESRLDKENRAKLFKAEKEAEERLIVQQMANAQRENEEKLLKEQKEEQRLLEEQKEKEEKLLKEQKEKEWLLKEQKEKERLLKEQKDKEQRLLEEQKEKELLLEEKKAMEEKLLKEQKEKEERKLKDQIEEQRLLKEQKEKERLLEEQKEKEKILKEKEDQLLKEQKRERLLKEQKEKEQQLLEEQKAKEEKLPKEQKEKEERELKEQKEEQLLKELKEKEKLLKEKEDQQKRERLDQQKRERLLKEQKEKEQQSLEEQKAKEEKLLKEQKEKEEKLLKEQKEKEERELKEQKEEQLLKELKEKEKLLKEKEDQQKRERIDQQKRERLDQQKRERLLKEQKEKEQQLLEEQKAKEEKLLKEQKEKEERELKEQKEEQLLKEQKEEQRLLKEKENELSLLKEKKEKAIKTAFQQDIKKELNTDLQGNESGLLNWFKKIISKK